MKLIFLFLIILFIFNNIVKSQYPDVPCDTSADCIDSPSICLYGNGTCFHIGNDGHCTFDVVSGCCTGTNQCNEHPSESCIDSYKCDTVNNVCVPVYAYCYENQPCSDYCKNSELTCETRSCIYDPGNESINNGCNVTSDNYNCEIDYPSTACKSYKCVYGTGCVATNIPCSDGLHCTIDHCNEIRGGCEHYQIPNCLECKYEACVTVNPCINAVCLDSGICEYTENCTTTSNTVSSTTTIISTTGGATLSSTTGTNTTGSTTSSTSTTGGTTSTTSTTSSATSTTSSTTSDTTGGTTSTTSTGGTTVSSTTGGHHDAKCDFRSCPVGYQCLQLINAYTCISDRCIDSIHHNDRHYHYNNLHQR